MMNRLGLDYLNDAAYLRAREALDSQRRARAITTKAIAWCKEQRGKEVPQMSRHETGKMMMSRILRRLNAVEDARALIDLEKQFTAPIKVTAECYDYVLSLLCGETRVIT